MYNLREERDATAGDPMRITLRFFARFGELLGNSRGIDAPEGTSVAGLIRDAATGNTAGYDAIFDERGAFRDHVILMVNRQRIRSQDAESVPVTDGDTIAVFPPVAGG